MHESQLVQKLESLASEARARIIMNSHKTNTPHLGSCLSCVDILIAMYFYKLKIKAEDPRAEDRDRFILSKGHGAAALFQILAMKGFYEDALLADYGQNGSLFAEHPPTPDHLPGIEAATGSLGHGLPIGVGMALSSRVTSYDYNVYVLLGDGECNEGSIWEAATMTAAQNLTNINVFVDANKWQATDRSADLVGATTLKEKWEAFGWQSVEIDGNDMKSILEILDKDFEEKKPLAVILHTKKGAGVSFMEDDNNWHYRIPSNEEVEIAKKELNI